MSDSLERDLPADFWLETLALGAGWDEELGVERADERPFLRMRGRAREGTDSPALLWEEFLLAFKSDLPEARVKDRMGQSGFTLDMTSLARAAESADDEEGADEAQEN